jgi:hypothetical protein
MSTLKDLARFITEHVARETASILHMRHDLGIEDSDMGAIDEKDFCDEAVALANGEECGCMDPEEAIQQSLVAWVETQLRTHFGIRSERVQ